jgi:hypothetical protein
MCPSSEVCTDYARNLIRIKAKQVVRGRGFNRSELPDIEQELFFHLIKQAPNFDPKRSALNTFIAKVVDSAAGMVVRARRCDIGKATADITSGSRDFETCEILVQN